MASIEDIAREVIQGKWGSGAARKEALTNSGYDYATVQNTVNSMLGGGYGGTSSASADEGNGIRSQINEYQSKLTNLGDAPKYQSKYQDQINSIANRINNFTFNPDEDANYQVYKQQYTREGEKAMEDTLGKLSARTGGLASSYAATASQNAYNNYMQQLANKIPELSQLALSKLQNDLANYRNLENDNMNEYKLKLNEYDNMRNYYMSAKELLEQQLKDIEAKARQVVKGSSPSSSKKKTDEDEYVPYTTGDPIVDAGVTGLLRGFNLF